MNLIPPELRCLPHVKEHNWLNNKLILDFLTDCAPRYVSGTMVDIGCGVKPYSTLFAPYVDRHIGVDYEKSPHGTSEIDVIGTAYDTGLPDTMCDVVLCTEVLEHLEKPIDAAKEMHRILKPGGIVILTVPFFWPVHEAPRDFYRYSNFGLQYIFETAGFDVIEIRPMTGFVVTVVQLTVYYLRRFHRGPFFRAVGRLFNYALQALSYRLNRYDKSIIYTNLYGLIARKAE